MSSPSCLPLIGSGLSARTLLVPLRFQENPDLRRGLLRLKLLHKTRRMVIRMAMLPRYTATKPFINNKFDIVLFKLTLGF